MAKSPDKNIDEKIDTVTLLIKEICDRQNIDPEEAMERALLYYLRSLKMSQAVRDFNLNVESCPGCNSCEKVNRTQDLDTYFFSCGTCRSAWTRSVSERP